MQKMDATCNSYPKGDVEFHRGVIMGPNEEQKWIVKLWECTHKHRTEEAAIRCAQKEIRCLEDK